jgi:hypothetical protein
MKRHSVLILAFIIALAGCNSADPETAPAPGGKTTAKLTPIPNVGAYSLATPISYGSATFIPVVANAPASKEQQQDYASLLEAKQNGWVEIVEMPGDEQVEFLTVRNNGPKPLLLLGGELLLGGKQDRVVAHDTIVPAGKEQKVSVYCVEPGRWQGSSEKFEAKSQFVPHRVRDAATYKGQQEVWDGVGGFNAAASPAAASEGTVNAGMSDERVQSEIQKGLSQVVDDLKKQQNVVGVLVALNGKIETLELFGNSKLFDSAREPLLTSFLSEAAVSKNKSPNSVSMEEATQFLSDVLNSRRRYRGEQSGGIALQTDLASDKLAGRELAGAKFSGRLDTTREGKPAAEAGGLIHGTYKNR